MSGPEWQPLMRAVYRRVCEEARERGYAVLVINEDVSSPLALCLLSQKGGAPPRSPTSFWQKDLSAPAKPSASPAAFGTDAFFDPRDM